MNRTSENVASRRPHLFAVLLAACTFPLIWVGGLVTSYDAGMAVPDWPGTYGYNLFLYPWQTWFFGPWDLFIEHSHRLLGAVVGILALALAFVTWRYDRRRWLLAAALVGVALVIVQGLLGGARVLLDERLVALVHGCVGPLFFAWTAALVVFTSKFWTAAVPDAAVRQYAKSAWIAVGLVFVQIALGAVLRHVPVSASPEVFRAAVWFHLILAAALTIHVLLLTGSAVARLPRRHPLRTPASVLTGLVVVQLTLGMATWVVKYSWPAWLVDYSFAAGYVVQEKSFLQATSATAHVAGGSLILFMATLLALRATRLCDGALASATVPRSIFLGTAA